MKRVTQKRKSYITHKEDRQLLSQEDKFFWVSRRVLKAETESEIIAAQSEALQNICHSTNTINSEPESKCRLNKKYDETIDHKSTCPTLAREQYIKHHHRAWVQLRTL
jgi:hypothetical protein